MADQHPEIPEADRLPLGAGFAGQHQLPEDLPAPAYRSLARDHAEKSAREPHGPRGDRHAQIALAYALCALSADEEDNRCLIP